MPSAPSDDEVRALERLCDSEHERDCVRNGFLRGRPTGHGGYEMFYKTPEVTKWYEAKPIDLTPKCDCGLDAAAKTLRRMARLHPLRAKVIEEAKAWANAEFGEDALECARLGTAVDDLAEAEKEEGDG